MQGGNGVEYGLDFDPSGGADGGTQKQKVKKGGGFSLFGRCTDKSKASADPFGTGGSSSFNGHTSGSNTRFDAADYAAGGNASSQGMGGGDFSMLDDGTLGADGGSGFGSSGAGKQSSSSAAKRAQAKSDKYGVNWLEDSSVRECRICGEAFGMTRRKHHCRNCGTIVCNACSKARGIIQGHKGKKRVCSNCEPLVSLGPGGGTTAGFGDGGGSSFGIPGTSDAALDAGLAATTGFGGGGDSMSFGISSDGGNRNNENETRTRSSSKAQAKSDKYGVNWLEDSSVRECRICGEAFGMTRRKHHCRNCGTIVCNACSKARGNVQGHKGKKRICANCEPLVAAAAADAARYNNAGSAGSEAAGDDLFGSGMGTDAALDEGMGFDSGGGIDNVGDELFGGGGAETNDLAVFGGSGADGASLATNAAAPGEGDELFGAGGFGDVHEEDIDGADFGAMPNTGMHNGVDGRSAAGAAENMSTSTSAKKTTKRGFLAKMFRSKGNDKGKGKAKGNSQDKIDSIGNKGESSATMGTGARHDDGGVGGTADDTDLTGDALFGGGGADIGVELDFGANMAMGNNVDGDDDGMHSGANVGNSGDTENPFGVVGGESDGDEGIFGLASNIGTPAVVNRHGVSNIGGAESTPYDSDVVNGVDNDGASVVGIYSATDDADPFGIGGHADAAGDPFGTGDFNGGDSDAGSGGGELFGMGMPAVPKRRVQHKDISSGSSGSDSDGAKGTTGGVGNRGFSLITKSPKQKQLSDEAEALARRARALDARERELNSRESQFLDDREALLAQREMMGGPQTQSISGCSLEDSKSPMPAAHKLHTDASALNPNTHLSGSSDADSSSEWSDSSDPDGDIDTKKTGSLHSTTPTPIRPEALALANDLPPTPPVNMANDLPSTPPVNMANDLPSTPLVNMVPGVVTNARGTRLTLIPCEQSATILAAGATAKTESNSAASPSLSPSTEARPMTSVSSGPGQVDAVETLKANASAAAAATADTRKSVVAGAAQTLALMKARNAERKCREAAEQQKREEEARREQQRLEELERKKKEEERRLREERKRRAQEKRAEQARRNQERQERREKQKREQQARREQARREAAAAAGTAAAAAVLASATAIAAALSVVQCEEEAMVVAKERAEREAEERARLEAEAQARRQAEEEAKRKIIQGGYFNDEREKAEREAEAAEAAEAKRKQDLLLDAEYRSRRARENREAEKKALEAEALRKAREAAEKVRRDAEMLAKHEAEKEVLRARREGEEAARRNAMEKRAQLAAEQEQLEKQAAQDRAKQEAEAQARRKMQEKARHEAEQEAQRAALEKAKVDAFEEGKRAEEERLRSNDSVSVHKPESTALTDCEIGGTVQQAEQDQVADINGANTATVVSAQHHSATVNHVDMDESKAREELESESNKPEIKEKDEERKRRRERRKEREQDRSKATSKGRSSRRSSSRVGDSEDPAAARKAALARRMASAKSKASSKSSASRSSGNSGSSRSRSKRRSSTGTSANKASSAAPESAELAGIQEAEELLASVQESTLARHRDARRREERVELIESAMSSTAEQRAREHMLQGESATEAAVLQQEEDMFANDSWGAK